MGFSPKLNIIVAEATLFYMFFPCAKAQGNTFTFYCIAKLYSNIAKLYQQLWCTYFDSVNITARKNMKLYIQHMPKRYWRYLTEKKGSFK